MSKHFPQSGSGWAAQLSWPWLWALSHISLRGALLPGMALHVALLAEQQVESPWGLCCFSTNTLFDELGSSRLLACLYQKPIIVKKRKENCTQLRKNVPAHQSQYGISMHLVIFMSYIWLIKKHMRKANGRKKLVQLIYFWVTIF
jgi:hypothetical protein